MDNLLNIDRLKKTQISDLIQKAFYLKENRTLFQKNKPLEDKNIILLFLEPSTRTKTSFEMACTFLGANIINITSTNSSILKGETTENTLRTLNSYPLDALIMRDSVDDSHELAASIMDCPVINAGSGISSHPTQNLIDMMTLNEADLSLQNLKLTIVGDVTHSRVARSSIAGFSKMGSDVSICCPDYFKPDGPDQSEVQYFETLNEALGYSDVVMGLRIQNERLSGEKVNIDNYTKRYQITEKLLVENNIKALLHPGPLNEGIEVEENILKFKNSLIMNQVENGIWMRCAVMTMLMGLEI